LLAHYAYMRRCARENILSINVGYIDKHLLKND